MRKRILLTGSEGVIGQHLKHILAQRGFEVVPCDIQPSTPGGATDIRARHAVSEKVRGCHGILHLAAVSRVAQGEADPARCHTCNIEGTGELLRAALQQPQRPWLLFTSSREVYGNPLRLPATEDTPMNPVNVYGHSKVEGEKLVREATLQGLRTGIVRLSNVYGSPDDYPDRVIPAFVHAACHGRDIRVDGPARRFDFTHIDDVIRGILLMLEALDQGRDVPILQLTSGQSISLLELAEQIKVLSQSRSLIRKTEADAYTVSSFSGTSERALLHLGWRAQIALHQGLHSLVNQLSMPGLKN
ncbi:MAG: NAD-dependent epimerase/dehydratase family protein [Myxococcota bacterium]